MTQTPTENQPQPTLSFGLPVRNGSRFLRRALQSLEAQDFRDFEVVVCDNQSTDETGDIVREFEARDPRFKYCLNETNVGQIDNFNLAFERSRGRYFRWIGSDDWLDPRYASRCVETLEANPDAIGVGTVWRYVDDAGNEDLIDYITRSMDSKSVLHRIGSMLWVMQSPIGCDPIYSTLRRSALQRTGMLPISTWNDRILALDLAMTGPFCHISECLSTRRHNRVPAKVRLAEYHPTITTERATDKRMAHRWTMYRELLTLVLASSLGLVDRFLGATLVVLYGALHHIRAFGQRVGKLLGS